MYPILFRIHSFPINTYGVFLALAFLGAIFVTVKLAERDGLPRERIYDLCLWLLLSSLVGSKLLMFFTEPEYREHPLQLFSLDFLRSGGVFYGGLPGALIAGYFLMKRWKLSWWKTAAGCAPGVAFGRSFLRRTAGRLDRRLFPDEAMEAALVEDRECLRPGDCIGECAGATG